MTAQTPAKLHYGTFTIERTYKHAPKRVLRAFEDAEAHFRWFVSGEGWEIASWTHDFSVGGHAHGTFRPVGHSSLFGNDTWNLDIGPNRIIVAYTMTMDGRPMSHSLAVTELYSDGEGGCRLIYTEQGAYYGGETDVKNRRGGCEELFDKLEFELREHA